MPNIESVEDLKKQSQEHQELVSELYELRRELHDSEELRDKVCGKSSKWIMNVALYINKLPAKYNLLLIFENWLFTVPGKEGWTGIEVWDFKERLKNVLQSHGGHFKAAGRGH